MQTGFCQCLEHSRCLTAFRQLHHRNRHHCLSAFTVYSQHLQGMVNALVKIFKIGSGGEEFAYKTHTHFKCELQLVLISLHTHRVTTTASTEQCSQPQVSDCSKHMPSNSRRRRLPVRFLSLQCRIHVRFPLFIFFSYFGLHFFFVQPFPVCIQIIDFNAFF